jgi:hypothetical protein
MTEKLVAFRERPCSMKSADIGSLLHLSFYKIRQAAYNRRVDGEFHLRMYRNRK